MKYFLMLIMIVFHISSYANDVPHIVIVTPRGETAMEHVFKHEIQNRFPFAKFTMISPNVNDEGAMAALPNLVKSYLPTLIYTWGTPTTLAVAGTYDKPIITDIPIVFTVVQNPLGVKIVQNLKKPGKNVTGTSHLVGIPMQLQTMKEYMPFKTLGVIYNPREPNSLLFIDDLQKEARLFGINVIAQRVDLDRDDDPIATSIPNKVRDIKKAGAEWLMLAPDTFVQYTNRRLTTFTATHLGLPSFTSSESAIRDGNATLGLYSPVTALAKFTASKALQILSKEKKPGEIPVETLQKFTTVINMCQANYMRIYPQYTAMFRFSEVITAVETVDKPMQGCKLY